MIVTDITTFDKKRSKVYIDGEFTFVLYKSEIRNYRLEAGEEISSPVFDEIKNTLLPGRAKKRAMNLMQKRDYTEHKLKEKLKEGMYPDEAIEEAMDYMKSFRYIDDERYADDYVRYHISDKSRRRIQQDLLQKGISSDLIEKVMESAYSEEDENPELEQCIMILKKKHYDPNIATYEDKKKLLAFLYRKGFESETIQRAMSLDTEHF